MTNYTSQLAYSYCHHSFQSLVFIHSVSLSFFFSQLEVFTDIAVSILLANLQDLAWGTKGSTTVKDLGGATKKKTEDGKELVEVDIPTAPDDVDALWLVSKPLY